MVNNMTLAGATQQQKRYIALLRGINISGKNKIAMSELKAGFENLAFQDVITYLNSGNVVFNSEVYDKKELIVSIESMIKKKFNMDIPVFVISQEELLDVLYNAPEWWGNNNKEVYDNLIFIISPFTYDKLYSEIGSPKKEYEKVTNYKGVVFWSFSRKDYQKTIWWAKTASTESSKNITIRTASTIRKLVEK